MRRELSTCAIRKFNGCELLRKDLERKEFQPLISIDIVYEPTIDLKKAVFCYFCPQKHLAFRTGVEKFRKGEKYMHHAGARQCHYCNNYFVKSEEKMNHNLSVFAATAGVTYSFDNGKIIDYQGNYKFIEDVPFSIYFDFETTTGSVVFFDAKMYVVSCCIIAAFHNKLDLPKLAIFRIFDQDWEDLIDLDRFNAIEEIFLLTGRCLML